MWCLPECVCLRVLVVWAGRAGGCLVGMQETAVSQSELCRMQAVQPSFSSLPRCHPAGVLKVIDVRRQQQSGGKKKDKQKGGKGQPQAAATGAQALKALLQPVAVDVGGGAGLPAWD